MKLEQIEKAYNVIKNGGLAIVPSRVGYTLLGNSEESIRKMFKIKNRPLSKPCIVLTNRDVLYRLAIISREKAKAINKIAKRRLLCGFVLKRKKHRLYNSLSDWTSYYSQKGGTSCFVINGGEYLDYLVEKSVKDRILIVGSSANQSGTGNEGVFSKIPQEIRNDADFAVEDDVCVSKEYNSETREQGVMVEWRRNRPFILRRGPFVNQIENILKSSAKDNYKIDYDATQDKVSCPIEFTKYLLATHPVQLITTIGKVNGKIMPNVAPFATCLDTSYDPPYVTFALSVNQHTLHGQPSTKSKMNTYLNMKQNGMFIVNTPTHNLIKDLNILSYPYKRKELKDKIRLAKLTRINPLVLSETNSFYPPIVKECIVHIECEVVDIHRPKGSDHHLITGKVLGVSYDKSLGKEIDEVRLNLVRQVFHHFGSSSKNNSIRYIGKIVPDTVETIPFKLEEKFSGKEDKK